MAVDWINEQERFQINILEIQIRSFYFILLEKSYCSAGETIFPSSKNLPLWSSSNLQANKLPSTFPQTLPFIFSYLYLRLFSWLHRGLHSIKCIHFKYTVICISINVYSHVTISISKTKNVPITPFQGCTWIYNNVNIVFHSLWVLYFPILSIFIFIHMGHVYFFLIIVFILEYMQFLQV